MYISRIEATLPKEKRDAAKEKLGRELDNLKTKAGLRWAMLLQAMDGSGGLAAVSMWLTPEQAAPPPSEALGGAKARGYDVTTARGDMTPATHAAIADWEVDEAVNTRFTGRWNAMYHAIEDRIGSRLMKDLQDAGRQAGFHVMTDASHLNPEMFASALTDAEGLSIRPEAVQTYEVLKLVQP